MPQENPIPLTQQLPQLETNEEPLLGIFHMGMWGATIKPLHTAAEFHAILTQKRSSDNFRWAHLVRALDGAILENHAGSHHAS